jgi:hypothetical protein
VSRRLGGGDVEVEYDRDAKGLQRRLGEDVGPRARTTATAALARRRDAMSTDQSDRRGGAGSGEDAMVRAADRRTGEGRWETAQQAAGIRTAG